VLVHVDGAGAASVDNCVSLVGGLLGGHYSPAPSVVGHC
jgi:hypothetical protein